MLHQSTKLKDPAMDATHILGIPEIDAQHEEIAALVKSLREAIARKNLHHLVDPALKRLHQLLVTHFAYEESFMDMISSPEREQHRKMHKGVLRLLNDYFDHPPATADYEQLGRLVSDRVLAHVMDHDVHMTKATKEYLNTFRST